MINQIFTLTRPLIVFDAETTSLNPAEARIVEFGFQLWKAEGLSIEYRTLVNPEMPIPPETTKVHHIDDEDVTVKCRLCRCREAEHPTADCAEYKPVPKFSQIAERLAAGFSDVDWAGKNIRFDLRVLSAEMARAGVAWSFFGARVIDADRLEQLGEPRSLSHLYEKHTGQRLEDAHQALADVRATTEVIVAQMRKYAHLPRSLDLLHQAQWPGEIDQEGKFKFDNDGIPRIRFGKYNGTSMQDIPQDYYRWLLKSDFNKDVKEIVQKALNGQFPSK